MPAAAAAVLLDWQPVLVLEKENYALREENRHLHFQVQELMAWKERALKQMLALGPKRQRANRDVQQATQLQRKLQHVEKSLLDRRALEETNEKLHETQRGLEQRVEQLVQEVETLQQRLSETTTREARARAHVQGIADQFREHLEHLVAIRERLDSEADETTGQIPEDETDPVSPPINEEEEQVIEDPTVLLSGLGAVSTKCLQWFHEHVAQSYSTIQEKAALYEAQHAELQQLRLRVQAIGHDVEFSVAKEKQQTQQLLQIQSDKTQLETEIQKLRTLHVHKTRVHSVVGDHVRLLATEVRQYLRLVRAEIKKKFGYVPDAITHADNWARILDALDVLERQLRVSNA